MGEATRILSAIEAGESAAAEQLLPLVYDELRKLAALRLAQEKPGQTLHATALVHEAFLRLVDGEKVQHWNSRRHFFAAAAEAMRRILVDNARRKRRPKAGGDRKRIEFDENVSAHKEARRPVAVASRSAREAGNGVARQSEAGQTALLRRSFPSGGRRGPRNLTCNRRSLLGLRQSVPLFRDGGRSEKT